MNTFKVSMLGLLGTMFFFGLASEAGATMYYTGYPKQSDDVRIKFDCKPHDAQFPESPEGVWVSGVVVLHPGTGPKKIADGGLTSLVYNKDRAHYDEFTQQVNQRSLGKYEVKTASGVTSTTVIFEYFGISQKPSVQQVMIRFDADMMQRPDQANVFGEASFARKIPGEDPYEKLLPKEPGSNVKCVTTKVQ